MEGADLNLHKAKLQEILELIPPSWQSSKNFTSSLRFLVVIFRILKFVLIE